MENRAGANMIIASEAAARATPDGYTLIMVPSNHVINGGLYAKLTYDPIKDFAPVARLANLPLVVAVHPSLPVSSMAELIALAKTKNGDLAYSSSGIGSPHHLGMELVKYTGKVEMTHIPFKGASDALAETLSGRVPVGIFHRAAGAAAHQGWQVACDCVGGFEAHRSASRCTDRGRGQDSRDFRSTCGWACWPPAGTPQAVIDKLNAELVAIVNAPDVREQLRAQGFEPAPSTSEEFLV